MDLAGQELGGRLLGSVGGEDDLGFRRVGMGIVGVDSNLAHRGFLLGRRRLFELGEPGIVDVRFGSWDLGLSVGEYFLLVLVRDRWGLGYPLVMVPEYALLATALTLPFLLLLTKSLLFLALIESGFNHACFLELVNTPRKHTSLQLLR